jgi:2'-5' RNA ligase
MDVPKREWTNGQKAYAHGTLVVWPPDEVRDVVNRLRTEYDPVSQSVCEAHITVTQPLLGPLSSIEWSHMETLLSDIDAFEIQYGPLSSFLPYPCIHYEIHPGEKLLRIRELLHETGFFNLRMPHPENWVMHMTITEGLSGPEVNHELLVSLKRRVAGGSFTCTAISYIIPDSEFHFKVVRTLCLRQDAQ